MNAKRVSICFVLAMLLELACAWILKNYFPRITDSLVLTNLICEAVYLLPGLIFVFASGEKLTEFLRFRKMKPGTILAVIPFAMFTAPFITLLNLLSQFVTDNAVVNMITDYDMAEMSFVPMFFSIAIVAPLCEETICRGVYYRGYKKSIGAFWAMLLSSLLFGAMHMNVNQAVYALGMGILAVLLVEASGSLWASVLYHGLINASSVILMYILMQIDPGVYSQTTVEQITSEMLVYSVSVYLVISAVCLPLAWALLVWMAGHEGRSGVLREIWESKKKKGIAE